MSPTLRLAFDTESEVTRVLCVLQGSGDFTVAPSEVLVSKFEGEPRIPCLEAKPIMNYSIILTIGCPTIIN